MDQRNQLNYVRQLIEVVGRIRDKKRQKFVLRYMLPYSTTKLKNGNTLFLNREYKPIVFSENGPNEPLVNSSDFVNYEDFENISFNSKKSDDVYFYNDNSAPWDGQKNLKAYIENIKSYIKVS